MENDFLKSLVNQQIVHITSPEEFRRILVSREIAPTIIDRPILHILRRYSAAISDYVPLIDLFSCKRNERGDVLRHCLDLMKRHQPQAVVICYCSAISPDLIHPDSPGEVWHPGPLPLALAESVHVIDWESGEIKPVSWVPIDIGSRVT